jgi:hypothetical protein
MIAPPLWLPAGKFFSLAPATYYPGSATFPRRASYDHVTAFRSLIALLSVY